MVQVCSDRIVGHFGLAGGLDCASPSRLSFLLQCICRKKTGTCSLPGLRLRLWAGYFKAVGNLTSSGGSSSQPARIHQRRPKSHGSTLVPRTRSLSAYPGMDRREYSRNPDGKWAPGYHPAGRLFLAGFLQACRECGKDNPTLLHSRNGCETGHPTQISSLSHKADLDAMAGQESLLGFFLHQTKWLKLLEMATSKYWCHIRRV